MGRALDPLRYEDEGSGGEAVRPAVYAYLSRARHAHEEYVYLIVHVLADAISLVEPDQVDVEVAALPEVPDDARLVPSGGEYLRDPGAVPCGRSRS